MQNLIEEILIGPALFVLRNISLQPFEEMFECNNYVAVFSTTSPVKLMSGQNGLHLTS